MNAYYVILDKAVHNKPTVETLAKCKAQSFGFDQGKAWLYFLDETTACAAVTFLTTSHVGHNARIDSAFLGGKWFTYYGKISPKPPGFGPKARFDYQLRQVNGKLEWRLSFVQR
jgi:hypothetical protein